MEAIIYVKYYDKRVAVMVVEVSQQMCCSLRTEEGRWQNVQCILLSRSKGTVTDIPCEVSPTTLGNSVPWYKVKKPDLNTEIKLLSRKMKP